MHQNMFWPGGPPGRPLPAAGVTTESEVRDVAFEGRLDHLDLVKLPLDLTSKHRSGGSEILQWKCFGIV